MKIGNKLMAVIRTMSCVDGMAYIYNILNPSEQDNEMPYQRCIGMMLSNPGWLINYYVGFDQKRNIYIAKWLGHRCCDGEKQYIEEVIAGHWDRDPVTTAMFLLEAIKLHHQRMEKEGCVP